MTSKLLISILVGGVILTGCGGSSSNKTITNTNTTNSTSKDTNTKQPTVSPSVDNSTILKRGKVSDGYIAKANVLIDINRNHKGLFEQGDYLTSTDINGQIILQNITVPKNTFIYAKGGTIISTGEKFKGTLKGIFTGDSTNINITPLTTMVTALVEKNPQSVQTEDIQKAKEKIATVLNIPLKNIEADPVINKEAFKAVQKVVTIAKVLQTTNKKDSISDIIEKIAINVEDNNISQAITKVAGNETIAQIAIETAKYTEETIQTLLEKDDIQDTSVIENITQSLLVSKVLRTINDKTDIETVTKVLEEAENTITSNDTLALVKAMECLNFDIIKGENSSASAVTKPLNLSNKIQCEQNGSISIEWIKAEPNNIDLKTGDILPAKNPITVKLDANISSSSAWLIKPIFFTIAPKTETETQNTQTESDFSANSVIETNCTIFNPLNGQCED